MRVAAALILTFAINSSAIGRGETVKELKAIGPYVAQCWKAPVQKPAGIEVELVVGFALRRDGSVIGEPRITYLSPGLSKPLRDNYLDAVRKMLEACAPIPLSPELGAAIAGRQHRLRLVDDGVQHKDKEPWRQTPKTPSSWKHLRDA